MTKGIKKDLNEVDVLNITISSLEDNLNEISTKDDKYLIGEKEIKGNSYILIYKEYKNRISSKLNSIKSELEKVLSENKMGHYNKHFINELEYLSEAISYLNQIPKIEDEDRETLNTAVNGIKLYLQYFDNEETRKDFEEKVKVEINYDRYMGILYALRDNLNEIKVVDNKYKVRDITIDGNPYILIYEEYKDKINMRLTQLKFELDGILNKAEMSNKKQVHVGGFFIDKLNYLSEAISYLNQIPKLRNGDKKILSTITLGIELELKKF